MISASTALERLRAGNQRFVDGSPSSFVTRPGQLDQLAEGQAPFATILGCSDSRVPVEIVFDQGLGDLFVIRVAGNIVESSQIGSVEFAAEQFSTPLVVVLGHSRCGAVQATVQGLKQQDDLESSHLHTIVDRIRPCVVDSQDDDGKSDLASRVERAVRANVRASVSRLSHNSACIARRIRADQLRVVGAVYSLQTGAVEFLD